MATFVWKLVQLISFCSSSQQVNIRGLLDCHRILRILLLIRMASLKFIIVGAGFGGLGMGATLKTAGYDDFIILEKGSGVGGVWRDNSYPGCTWDVPSHLYSFFFAPYKGREKRFPPQEDILGYLEGVAQDYELEPHIRLNTEVSSASWHEEEGLWEVITKNGLHLQTEFVVFAAGQLHRPKYPDIEGLVNFEGPVMHPAVWDHDVKLAGKNIAIIGTGSSAAQMLPPIASMASTVTVFQRTPQWVLPKANEDFSAFWRSLLRIPGMHALYRTLLRDGADAILAPIPRSKVLRKLAQWLALHNLYRQIPDRNLREKLTPSYPIGTKRILFDSKFFSTFNRPNVKLATEPIHRITPRGVETNTGHFSVDVLIVATGFKASEFLLPITITGRNGANLNEQWSGGGEAYMGLAVPSFPNLFIIAGPSSFNPSGSNPGMKEIQIAYIMRCAKWKFESGARAIEVREDVMSNFKKWKDERIKKTVWGQGSSWYRHEGTGKVVNPWPGTQRAFKKKLSADVSRAFFLDVDHHISERS